MGETPMVEDHEAATDNLFVHYVGFEVTPLFRAYNFDVHVGRGKIRAFTLTISTEAFDTHRARFQDAPSICSIKLRKELGNHDNNPVETSYSITDTELEAYRDTYRQKTSRSPYSRKVI
jgi:hypothetical protein